VVLLGEHRQHEVERLLAHLVVELVGQLHDAFLVGPDLVPHDLRQAEEVQPGHEERARDRDDRSTVRGSLAHLPSLLVGAADLRPGRF
jgi:hypothetical protein